jgi:hypothetical protein
MIEISSGTDTEWFRVHPNMEVQFGLNMADALAKPRNKDATLRMMTDVRLSAGGNAAVEGRLFPHAVIAPANAALSIRIRCAAKVGFGFSIRSNAETVVDKLYAVDRVDENGMMTATIRRYQSSSDLLTIDSARARIDGGVSTAEAMAHWSCDIEAWPVLQYLDPISGRVYDERHPRNLATPPARPVRQAAPPLADGLGMATASSGVGAGGLWRDEGAEQVFERIQVQKESPQERFGVLHVTFLVAR